VIVRVTVEGMLIGNLPIFEATLGVVEKRRMHSPGSRRGSISVAPVKSVPNFFAVF